MGAAAPGRDTSNTRTCAGTRPQRCCGDGPHPVRAGERPAACRTRRSGRGAGQVPDRARAAWPRAGGARQRQRCGCGFAWRARQRARSPGFASLRVALGVGRRRADEPVLVPGGSRLRTHLRARHHAARGGAPRRPLGPSALGEAGAARTRGRAGRRARARDRTRLGARRAAPRARGRSARALGRSRSRRAAPAARRAARSSLVRWVHCSRSKRA